MVIFVNGQKIGEKSILNLLVKNEFIEKTTEIFFKKKPITFDENTPTVHVFQKECIHLNNCESIKYTGSSEATTCLMIGLWNAKQGCYFAHLDDQGDAQLSPDGEFSQHIDKFFPISGDEKKIVCHLIGSYVEDSGTSATTLEKVLAILSRKSQIFDVHTAVIDELNTEKRVVKSEKIDYPRCTAFCVDVETGEALPSIYPNFLKNFSMQHWFARNCRDSGGENLLPLQCYKDVFQIAPFTYKAYNDDTLLYLLMMDPEEMLETLSTSPKTESKEFVPVLKLRFKFQLENSDPEEYFMKHSKMKFSFNGKNWE